jgi:aminopeptidase
MRDQRVEKLAKVLINYSLALKKGDQILISGNTVSEPIMKACYVEALKAGAHPQILAELEGQEHAFYTYASDDQLDYVSPVQELLFKTFTHFLSFWGAYNTRELSNIASEKIARRRRANGPMQKIFFERWGSGAMTWCGTQFPTEADAQEASMSLDEYEDFVYGAGLIDHDDPVAEWRKVSAQQEKIVQFLNKKSEIRVLAEDTDLRVNVKGRLWENCDGKVNFPDGEVFTGPVEDSVEGHIRFSFPGIYAGKEVEDIKLWFEKGRVVNAEAKKGEELLRALIDTDQGARYVGEFAIGTNYGIQTFTRNMLFDEKFGGTMHMALGNGIPATGSQNQSGIHWDMLCDMRNGGEIYADGELIYKNGRFTVSL